MDNDLTKEEKGFVVDVATTGNVTKAVLDNFDVDDPNYAGVKGHRLLRKDKIQNAIKSIADSIPDEKLSKVLLEGLDAGRQTQEGIDPDYAVRHKYLDTALKLKGSYDEKGNINILMPILVKFLNEKNDEKEIK